MRLMDSPLVHRLGWTLFHTLWQDAAIAVLFAVVILAMRRSTANARYLAGTIAFLSLAVTPMVTFLILRGDPVAKGFSGVDATQMLNRYSLSLAAEPSGSSALLERLEPATPLIVGFWLVGFLLMALRLLGGLLLVERTRRLAIATPNGEWQGRLDTLAIRLGIRRRVQLMFTDFEDMPSAIGVLKLAVLLPASAISRLSPTQIEALLAHELAHIQRHDYLVNLLQSALETVQFYHPAVWWISSVIRAERENCCDDLAVQAVGDRVCYARALASLEELRVISPRLAMTANGGSLMQRIKRILGGPSRVTRSGFAWLPCLALASMVLPFAAYTQAQHQDAKASDVPKGAKAEGLATPLTQIFENPEAEVWVEGKPYRVKDLSSSQKADLKTRIQSLTLTVDRAAHEAKRGSATRSTSIMVTGVPGFDWGWDWAGDDEEVEVQAPTRSLTVTSDGRTMGASAPRAINITRDDNGRSVSVTESSAQGSGKDAKKLALVNALVEGENRLQALELAKLSVSASGQDGSMSPAQQETLQKQLEELRAELKQLREEMHQALQHGGDQKWKAVARDADRQHLYLRMHSDAMAKQLAEHAKVFQFKEGEFKMNAEQQQRFAEDWAKHAQEFSKNAEVFKSDAMAKAFAEKAKVLEFKNGEFKMHGDQKRFAEDMAKQARDFNMAMKGFSALGGNSLIAPEPPSPPSQVLQVDGDQITVKKLPNGKLEIKVWKNGKAKTFRISGSSKWTGMAPKALIVAPTSSLRIGVPHNAKAPVAGPPLPTQPELPAPAAPAEPE